MQDDSSDSTIHENSHRTVYQNIKLYAFSDICYSYKESYDNHNVKQNNTRLSNSRELVKSRYIKQGVISCLWRYMLGWTCTIYMAIHAFNQLKCSCAGCASTAKFLSANKKKTCHEISREMN